MGSIIAGREAHGSIINGVVQFRNDGWFPLTRGSTITGDVVARLNEDDTVSLLGNFYIPRGTPVGAVIMYGTEYFSFNSTKIIGFNSHADRFSGAWLSIGLKTVNGNLVTQSDSQYKGHATNIFDGNYDATDISPVTIPIIRK